MPTISNSQSAEEGRPIHDHPSLVNERWPCLFEESMDMLEGEIKFVEHHFVLQQSECQFK